MSGLNPADIAVLQGHVDRREWLAYWSYLDAATLRETGDHNAYALLAAQLVEHSILVSIAARRCAAAIAAAEMRIAVPPDDGDLIAMSLVTEDLEFRRADLERAKGLVPGPAGGSDGHISNDRRRQ